MTGTCPILCLEQFRVVHAFAFISLFIFKLKDYIWLKLQAREYDLTQTRD